MAYWDGRVGALPPTQPKELDKAALEYQAYVAFMPEVLEGARYRIAQSGDVVMYQRLVKHLGAYEHDSMCRIAAVALLQLAARAEVGR